MAMSRYAEHYHIHSEGQEGFRKHSHMMRSIQGLVNVYEDARLSKQNVYAVYIDYNKASNTINQDRLHIGRPCLCSILEHTQQRSAKSPPTPPPPLEGRVGEHTSPNKGFGRKDNVLSSIDSSRVGPRGREIMHACCFMTALSSCRAVLHMIFGLSLPRKGCMQA